MGFLLGAGLGGRTSAGASARTAAAPKIQGRGISWWQRRTVQARKDANARRRTIIELRRELAGKTTIQHAIDLAATTYGVAAFELSRKASCESTGGHGYDPAAIGKPIADGERPLGLFPVHPVDLAHDTVRAFLALRPACRSARRRLDAPARPRRRVAVPLKGEPKMQLSTVEIPRTQARERALEYSREAKRTADPDQRRELEDIARAYRIAARDEVPLIALTQTIAAGGVLARTRVLRDRNGAETRREQYLVPALAVCRWEASYVYTRGVNRDGSLHLVDSLRRDQRYRKGRISFAAETFSPPPEGYEVGQVLDRYSWGGAWTAMVPIVPPRFRPSRGMGDRLVLWEVDDWQWTTPPAPPGDPALLRHVGGDIYAVEAIWDLTPLEQLVLAGRRPER